MNEKAKTVAAYALGGLVTWHCVYIVVASFVKLLPAHGPNPSRGELDDNYAQVWLSPKTPGSRPKQDIVDALVLTTQRWSQLTGAFQAWKLFAPDMARNAVFTELELRWPDRHVLIRDPREPANPDRYVVFPGTWWRRFNYEQRLMLVYARHAPELEHDSPEGWRKRVLQRTAAFQHSTRAYLQWRTSDYLREHPGEGTPTYAIFRAHVVPSRRLSSDGGSRPPPYSKSIARLELATGKLQAWDTIAETFVDIADVAPPNEQEETE